MLAWYLPHSWHHKSSSSSATAIGFGGTTMLGKRGLGSGVAGALGRMIGGTVIVFLSLQALKQQMQQMRRAMAPRVTPITSHQMLLGSSSSAN